MWSAGASARHLASRVFCEWRARGSSAASLCICWAPRAGLSFRQRVIRCLARQFIRADIAGISSALHQAEANDQGDRGGDGNDSCFAHGWLLRGRPTMAASA